MNTYLVTTQTVLTAFFPQRVAREQCRREGHTEGEKESEKKSKLHCRRSSTGWSYFYNIFFIIPDYGFTITKYSSVFYLKHQHIFHLLFGLNHVTCNLLRCFHMSQLLWLHHLAFRIKPADNNIDGQARVYYRCSDIDISTVQLNRLF